MNLEYKLSTENMSLLGVYYYLVEYAKLRKHIYKDLVALSCVYVVNLKNEDYVELTLATNEISYINVKIYMSHSTENTLNKNIKCCYSILEILTDIYYTACYKKDVSTKTHCEKSKHIDSILVNEKKKIVTVIFNDDDVQIAKCSPEDEFDIYVGVAICISRHLAGSKTKFKKFVDKTAKFVKEKKSLKKTHTKIKDK